MDRNNIWQILMAVFLPLVLTAQTENWVFTYNGSANSWDYANSIVYGADGNIYAAGSSPGSGTYEDFTVISLTAAGDSNWVYRYNGPVNGWDYANSIVYGADSNIYAAGTSFGNATDYDFLVISLTAAGDSNWVYRYNGPVNGWDYANSIVYGADSNIYVAGSSTGSGTDYDFLVISLTTTGDTNWVYRYNGPANSYDFAVSIAYGADGNIYVAGSSTGNGTYADFTVISLTAAGDSNWVYRYNGSANSWDYANSIVYGADGNIYVAGSSTGSGTDDDFTVISLTAAGDTNWVYRYNGPDNGGDYANSIVYSADSNIYAAGTSLGNGTSDDFTVISLTTAGDSNWVYRYNGPGNYVDFVHSIVYGADSNIYVAGSSRGSGTYDDFTVISLTAAGDTNWVYRYNGPANSYDFAVSIAYGADGNIYAAGSSTGNGTSDDFTVISLTPNLSVQEEREMIVMKNLYGTTIFSGPVLLPEGINCKVFDITGRVIAPDKMKPGIYFIELDGEITQKVVKVK